MNEIENEQVVQVVQEKMVEFENVENIESVDEILDQTIQDPRELPTIKRRKMSPRSRFLLRINGLLQQRVNINAALAENEELLEEGVDIPELSEIIQWQQEEIIRYDALIAMNKDHAIEMKYALKRNPRTGRYVIATNPNDSEIVPTKKINEGIDAFFSELIAEINEELLEIDDQLIEMQEEQIRMIQNKERKIIDTSDQFKKIENLNDRILHAEKIQKDLILYLNNY